MGRIMLDAWPVRARCPGCGEVRSHAVLSRAADGSRRLRCKSCGHEWEAGPPRVRSARTAESERRAARKPARGPRTCAACGREFVPANDAQVTCSKRCYEHARYGHGGAGLVLLAARAQRLERKMLEVT